MAIAYLRNFGAFASPTRGPLPGDHLERADAVLEKSGTAPAARRSGCSASGFLAGSLGRGRARACWPAPSRRRSCRRATEPRAILGWHRVEHHERGQHEQHRDRVDPPPVVDDELLHAAALAGPFASPASAVRFPGGGKRFRAGPALAATVAVSGRSSTSSLGGAIHVVQGPTSPVWPSFITMCVDRPPPTCPAPPSRRWRVAPSGRRGRSWEAPAVVPWAATAPFVAPSAR